jgi:hypothetical protein
MRPRGCYAGSFVTFDFFVRFVAQNIGAVLQPKQVMACLATSPKFDASVLTPTLYD